MTTAVGIPVYNEEASVGDLLTFALREPGIDELLAVDDCSTDGSYELMLQIARRAKTLRVLQAPERSGQLAAWRACAAASSSETICFIDADALPAPGAIGLLAAALAGDESLAVVSGRTIPDERSRRWPAARFRARALHRLRALQHVRNTIIGRFFAVRREWFLAATSRSDIIANDAFLGAAARRDGRRSRYLPEAVCYYGEAQTTFDFAAQRQRADAGYAQLRALRILQPGDEPAPLDYVRVLAAAAIGDPPGAAAWMREQLRARPLRAYRPSGRDAGGWELQPSTKRRLEPPSDER